MGSHNVPYCSWVMHDVGASHIIHIYRHGKQATHKRDRATQISESQAERNGKFGGGCSDSGRRNSRVGNSFSIEESRGWSLVLESANGLRTTGAALSLSPNAWLALDALGVAHKLTSIYAPVQKSYMTNVGTGTTQEVTFTKNANNGPRPVHRKALLETLAEELPTNTVRFSSKVTSIETQSQEASASSTTILRLEDGTIIKAKVLIGCDGVHSVVARYLGLTAPVNSGRWGVRGLAVFPQGHGLNHEVRQFLDGGKKAGFVPLTDKEIYWFLVSKSSAQGEHMTSDPKLIQRAVLEVFAKDFPPSYLDVVQHADLSTLSWAPLMYRVPWNVLLGNVSKGNITLAGDAMHPMTPDLGQGGCSALEDAVVLGRHIGNLFIQNGGKLESGDHVTSTLQNYVNERKWRAAFLITGSYLSGWVQDADSWWMKFLRDVVFYGLIFRKVFESIQYDCGKLPNVSSSKLDNQLKIE